MGVLWDERASKTACLSTAGDKHAADGGETSAQPGRNHSQRDYMPDIPPSPEQGETSQGSTAPAQTTKALIRRGAHPDAATALEGLQPWSRRSIPRAKRWSRERWDRSIRSGQQVLCRQFVLRAGEMGRVGTTRRLRSPLQTKEETAPPVLPTLSSSSSSSSSAKKVFPKWHVVAGSKMPQAPSRSLGDTHSCPKASLVSRW